MFGNGNLLGKKNTTSAFSAPGVWGMSEQTSLKRNNMWVDGSFIRQTDVSFYDGAVGNVFGTTSTRNIGPENANRKILVCVGWNGAAVGTAISAINVGGSAATLYQAPVAAAVGDGGSAIGYIAYPTGTSASVQISFPVGVSKIYSAVYSVIGTTVGSVYTSGGQTNVSSPLNTSLAGIRNNILISTAMSDNAGSTWTWASGNEARIAEDVYINPSNTSRMSVAIGGYLSSVTNTITATNANASSDVSMLTLVLNN